MVMRFDPFGEVDRQFQQLANRLQETNGAMAMDAYRRGDDVFIHFDLPGVDPASIELTAEQNTLTVRAERHWDREADDQILARERQTGSFMRQLMLGEHLDTENIDASYEGGVLTVKLSVAPAAKPRKIEVRGSGQRPAAIDVEASTGGDGDRGNSG